MTKRAGAYSSYITARGGQSSVGYVPLCALGKEEKMRFDCELVGKVAWTHAVGDSRHRNDGDALCRRARSQIVHHDESVDVTLLVDDIAHERMNLSVDIRI